MPTSNPDWLKAVYAVWYLLILLGIPVFLWSVPGSLSVIAHQLRRIADMKEKEKK